MDCLLKKPYHWWTQMTLINQDDVNDLADSLTPAIPRDSAMPAIAGTGRVPRETVVNAPHCSMTVKKPGRNIIQAEDQQERETYKYRSTWTGKIKLYDYGRLLRGRLILPLLDSWNYSLNQYRIAAQNFYIFDSSVGRHQQFNPRGSADVVLSGQLGVDRLNARFELALGGLGASRITGK
jgi:hypothetical protein